MLHTKFRENQPTGSRAAYRFKFFDTICVSIQNDRYSIYHLILYARQEDKKNQRTNGPVNAHLISWPSKAQNIQNLENIW